ncbi:MAG: sensor histidine kinase [Oscillospiraceae bacterium]
MKKRNEAEKQRRLLKKGSRRFTRGQLFVRRLIPVTLCAAALSAAATAVVCRALTYDIAEGERMVLRYYADVLQTKYSEKVSEDERGTFEAELKFRAVSSSNALSEGNEGGASIIYDAETGEILADSSKGGCIVVKRENDKPVYYMCDESAVDELLKMTEGRDVSYTEYYWKEVYIKDNRFIPSVFEIEQLDRNYDTVGSEEYRFDISADGWEMVTVGKDEINFCMIGGMPENEEAYKHLERRREYNMSLRETTEEEDGRIFTYQIPITIDGKDCRFSNTVIIDTFGGFSVYFIASYAAVFAVSLVIAWLWASKNYADLKAHYALDDYRRETTNAMAHDLKSPLMAISGYAENLKNADSKEKRDHYADAIIENVSYMDGIICDVLSLAKLETGAAKGKTENIELKDITAEVIKRYEPALSEKEISVQLCGGAVIEGDRVMMTHAIDNLISNAVKYTVKSGKIDINITDKAYVITNDCENMDGVNVAELWKPFVKGDNARSGKQGSGIGLSITENVFRLHGFSMNIEYSDGKFTVRTVL